MALTITKVAGADHVQGNRRIKVRDITFDSSYPTGGESLTAADVGLRKIEAVYGTMLRNADGTAARTVSYDLTNSKLLAYTTGSAEVANLTDLSTFSGRLVFMGY